MEEILSGDASAGANVGASGRPPAMLGRNPSGVAGNVAQALHAKTYLFGQYGPIDVGMACMERKLLASREPSPSGAGTQGPAGTFNISTAAALVVAASGAHVLQQSYRSQDADLESSAVLEALGVSTRVPAPRIDRMVAEAGVGFVFEPVISETMERLRFAFQEIPVPTIFALLLPLLNPGGAPNLVVGVHSAELTQKMAEVVADMGVRRAFVFRSSDGLDAISNTGTTQLFEVRQGAISAHEIRAGDFGLPAAHLDDLGGGNAATNAEIILEILRGQPGARRNIVLLNAAPGIVCAGKASSLEEGIRLAADAVDSGRALSVLQSLVNLSHQE